MDSFSTLITSAILFSCLFYYTHAQTCQPCAVLRCRDGHNCTHVPLVTCAPVEGCTGHIEKDECGCCDVCMTTIGQQCREESEPYKERKCARGLKCTPSSEETRSYDLGIEKNHTSRCERDTLECVDPVTKRKYGRGEVWVRDDFACDVCVCSSTGQPKCSQVKCNKVTCLDSKQVEDRCCTFCMQDDWDKGCQYDGAMYFDGEIIVLQDHSSICKCHKERWSCSLDPTHSFQQLAEKPKCIDDVKDYLVNLWSVWLPSECAHCECIAGGRGNCSVIHCLSPRCEQPFRLKGRCCSVCPEDYNSVCYYEDVKYFHGERVVLPDRCTLCTCENSQWRCASQRCKASKRIKEPFGLLPE